MRRDCGFLRGAFLVGLLAVSPGAMAEAGKPPQVSPAAGSVSSWGYNVDGELGTATTTISNAPVQVFGAAGTRPG